MIKREEAVKALQKIESLHAYESDIDDELKTLFAFANQPTLDDAIKVVEEMKNNPNNNFMTMNQVLTALKGLKEGKEKCIE